MKRSKQIEDLIKVINQINDDEIQEVEKAFMRTVRAAERKIRADEIREGLRKAGITDIKNNGRNLIIILGYEEKPDWFNRNRKMYSEEEEKRAIEAIKGMNLVYEIGYGLKRGKYAAKVIRIEV